jgi:hypothetical protein
VVRAQNDRWLGRLGRGKEDLRIVADDGLGIAVAEAQGGPVAGLAREALVPRLVQFQSVLEDLMRTSDAVIPLRFGTYAATDAGVRAVIASARWRFDEALARFDGQAEYEIAAFWPEMGPVLAEAARDPEVAALRERLLGAVAAFEDKVALGRLVEARVDLIREAQAQAVITGIRAVSPVCREHPVIDESQIATISVLVPRAAAEALEGAVAAIDRCLGGRVHFRLIGPLPPHSFCTLGIVQPRRTELAQACGALGLSGTVSQAQVQAAFRARVAAGHPDQVTDAQAPEAFRQVQEAFRLLSDALQHARVDLTGVDAEQVIVVEEVGRHPPNPGPDVPRDRPTPLALGVAAGE